MKYGTGELQEASRTLKLVSATVDQLKLNTKMNNFCSLCQQSEKKEKKKETQNMCAIGISV